MAAFGLLAAFTAAACSLLLDTSGNQCTQTSDCVARGGAFASMQCVNRVCASAAPVDAGPWGCLGDVVAPMPTVQTVNVVVPLIDLVSQKPVTAAQVFARVCAKIDVNCNSPLFLTAPDGNGLLQLTGAHALPVGFDGFVLIDPVLPDGGVPDAGADAAPPDVIVPSLVFFNPPLYQDEIYAVIVLVHTSSLGQIAAVEGTSLDPSLGAIFMETWDCNAHAAPGVSISLDTTTSTTQGFYFKGNLPDLNSQATDATGFAGFVNVSVTSHTVTGTLKATQQKIGTVTVFTRPSMISYTVLAPSP